MLNAETAFQDEIEPDIVITDIDPLPVAAASERSIPAVEIGNFTWDWIMAELFPDIREDIRRIGEMYNWGTYLRLPMGPRTSPFHETVDIPLLRRGSFPEEPCLLEPMRGRTATEILDQSDLHLLPGAVMNILKDPAPFLVDSNGADFIVSGGYLDFPFKF